jgi:hypothetical protein
MANWVGCDVLDIITQSCRNFSALQVAQCSYIVIIFMQIVFFNTRTEVSQKFSAVAYFEACCVGCTAYLIHR